MNDPRLFLAIDNCFAAKRWTEPDQWMALTRRLGLQLVETSADTECDPLYMGAAYMRRWAAAVRAASHTHGVRVANLYSGHGTYSTLGLAHTDNHVRLRFRDRWLKPMIRAAASLQAGVGFFCHAFSQSVLADRDRYRRMLGRLVEDLADVGRYAAEHLERPISVEQMYTPHQPPWTIGGAVELLQQVCAAGAALYVTVDTGHAHGQQLHLRPTAETIDAVLDGELEAGQVWLGHPDAYRVVHGHRQGSRSRGDAREQLTHLIEQHPYLYADPVDSDPYAWLTTLGPWSPIIHLQQTDNSCSSHAPFTGQHNGGGIIHPLPLMRALADGYRNPAPAAMPPRCGEIFLTIEVFAGTAAHPQRLVDQLVESVQYWRSAIPVDGIPLSQALANAERR